MRRPVRRAGDPAQGSALTCPWCPTTLCAARDSAACLNPYARVDFNGKLWICPFCYTRNHFPPHYASISETNLPAELFPTYTTIEYTLQRPAAPPPAYLFVVDVCLIEEELGTQAVAHPGALAAPRERLVGLVTFGTHVHVHELGFADCPKSYVFRGSKEFTSQQIQDQLFAGNRHRLRRSSRRTRASTEASSSRPSRIASFSSARCSRICRGIRSPRSRTVARRGARARRWLWRRRCSPRPSPRPARAMLFVGGPATDGGGQVVGKDLEQAMRSHKDIAKDAAPFMNKATKYYETVATQLCTNGHCLDVFACSLDQVGLAEMKVCAEKTGGMVVLAESNPSRTPCSRRPSRGCSRTRERTRSG